MHPSISLTSERTLRIAPTRSEGVYENCSEDELREHRLRLVLAWRDAIADSAFPWIREIVPSASCLLVEFDPGGVLFADAVVLVENTIRDCTTRTHHQHEGGQREIRIPACYDSELAPDLRTVARILGLNIGSVVERHLSASYIVECIGFSPGFAYIAGLDETLILPRRGEPRPRVQPGSIAIAGRHTAVYPHGSPGGWHLIGCTPVRVFDAHRAEPAMLRAGDAVTFYPISRGEFEAWQRRAEEALP